MLLLLLLDNNIAMSKSERKKETLKMLKNKKKNIFINLYFNIFHLHHTQTTDLHHSFQKVKERERVSE